MQQVYVSIISIIMSGFMLLSIAGVQLDSYDKRFMKQNLNAAGNELYNCILVGKNKKITLNEEMVITKVKKYLGARGGGLVGAIFVYDDYIVGIDNKCKKTVPDFYQIENDNLIDKVNNILKQISNEVNEKQTIPSIEAADSNDKQLHSILFNKITATTVFLVFKGKTYYTVSGFTLYL